MSGFDERRYRSDDLDLKGNDNELCVYQGGNGDWYLTIVPTGEKIGPTVRITTSGQRFDHLPVAVLQLWSALVEDEVVTRLKRAACAAEEIFTPDELEEHAEKVRRG